MSKPDAGQSPRLQVDSDEDAHLAAPTAKAAESAGAKVKKNGSPKAMTGFLHLFDLSVC